MVRYANSLKKGFQRHTGRNNRGVITCRHRGGGHKRLYRHVDFCRTSKSIRGLYGSVLNIVYDPNRSAFLAHILYVNGREGYILQPQGLKKNDYVLASSYASNSVGNCLPISLIPLGVNIHNIELRPGKGGQLVRAAGTSAVIIAKEGAFVTIRLPSKEVRIISKLCWATIGQVQAIERLSQKRTRGKAGQTRWLGRRPHVRGSAMNPCDHPHGGGEGRTSIGRVHPVSPWGKAALGVPTRQPKKYSNICMIRRVPAIRRMKGRR